MSSVEDSRSSGTIENLPLIARNGGRDGADKERRGGGAGGTAPPILNTTTPSSSSTFTPQLRSTGVRMTMDGRQQDQQQQFPASHRSSALSNSTFYPQQQQQNPQNVNSGDQRNSPPQFTHSPPPPYNHEYHDNETFDGSEDTPAQMGGPTVTCRVCEAEIPIEGKTNQHVVRCLQCNEVTPIRAAPPGKKYVRCPCNCLLVCKATSTRIACPRQNCRRVITLVSGPPNSGVPGTAIRAPVGTCRVQCAYCHDIFMFNTLTNQLAICPHCRKSSSVGANYTRSRSLLYFVTLMISTLFLIGVIVGISHNNDSFFMYAFMVALLLACAFLAYRFVFFIRIKASRILGPL